MLLVTCCFGQSSQISRFAASSQSEDASTYGKDRIVVDFTEDEFQPLALRSGDILAPGIAERIPELCQYYNEKYQEKNAFTLQDSLLSPGTTWNLVRVRSLIAMYNLTDFRDEPLAYLESMIITKKGIGLNLKNGYFRKNGKWVEGGAGYRYQFFEWTRFVNLDFEKYIRSKEVKIKVPYNQTYLYPGNQSFSNVETIQFLKELQYTISATPR